MISATVIGNIGKDAETKAVGSGDVTEFTVASNSYSKNGDVTTWVRVSFWGSRGPKIAQYLKKGTKVAVRGDLILREYQGANGKGASLEMRADDVELVSSKESRPTTAPAGRAETYDADEMDGF